MGAPVKAGALDGLGLHRRCLRHWLGLGLSLTELVEDEIVDGGPDEMVPEESSSCKWRMLAMMHIVICGGYMRFQLN